MNSRRLLDYETPQRPKRVSFLAKCNPKATRRSVVRKAVKSALVATVLWFVAGYFKPAIRADWRFTFPVWICSAVLAGAVCEWQVDSESL